MSPRLLAVAWLAVARAGDPDVAAAIEGLQDTSLRCADAVDQLVGPARADCLYGLGRLDEARRVAEAALAAMPGCVGGEQCRDLLVLVAILRARAGDEEALRGALARLDGDRADRFRALAVSAAALGRPQAAWPLVDEALRRWPKDQHAVRAAAEVASLDPRGVTPSAEAAIARPADVVLHHNKGVAALSAGDGARCLAEVEAGLALATDGESPPLLALGYACAVQAGRTAEASRLMIARRSIDALDAGSVVVHAGQLLDQGRARDADRLLALLHTADPDLLRQRGSLRIRCRQALGDLPGALAVALAEPSAPTTRANLAVALRNAGDPAGARRLLDATCPELRGRARTDCESVRSALP